MGIGYHVDLPRSGDSGDRGRGWGEGALTQDLTSLHSFPDYAIWTVVDRESMWIYLSGREDGLN